MKWENESGYVLYKQASEYLKSILGLPQLDMYTEREEFIPYYYYIISYLNTNLINLGTEDLKSLIEKIYEIFDYGVEKIISHEVLSLSEETGIYDSPEDTLQYDQEYFIFCWSDLLSTLCLRLKFQYAYLFEQEPEECCKCGAHGQTESDYESWQSGVYPTDECYDRTNYSRSNTAWGLSKSRFCECYQHE